MSESITQSLCDEELLSGPEPPVLLGEHLDILYTAVLWIISRQKFSFGKTLYFPPCQLKGFVLDATLQSVCNWYKIKTCWCVLRGAWAAISRQRDWQSGASMQSRNGPVDCKWNKKAFCLVKCIPWCLLIPVMGVTHLDPTFLIIQLRLAVCAQI